MRPVVQRVDDGNRRRGRQPRDLLASLDARLRPEEQEQEQEESPRASPLSKGAPLLPLERVGVDAASLSQRPQRASDRRRANAPRRRPPYERAPHPCLRRSPSGRGESRPSCTRSPEKTVPNRSFEKPVADISHTDAGEPRVAAELSHARLKRDARAQRRLLEEHEQSLALQPIRREEKKTSHRGQLRATHLVPSANWVWCGRLGWKSYATENGSALARVSAVHRVSVDDCRIIVLEQHSAKSPSIFVPSPAQSGNLVRGPRRIGPARRRLLHRDRQLERRLHLRPAQRRDFCDVAQSGSHGQSCFLLLFLFFCSLA